MSLISRIAMFAPLIGVAALPFFSAAETAAFT